MPKLFPVESEFETTEQAETYRLWFGAKVQASLDDPRPSLPHHAVMADIERIIAEVEREQSR